MMKIYNIYFSPTGGTERCADTIVSGLKDAAAGDAEVVDIDLADQVFAGCALDGESLSVISVPAFAGRVPGAAVGRIKMISGNGSRAVVNAVYGNREQEDTMIEAYDAAVESGFKVIAGIASIAEHSIARNIAAGRPDTEDETQLKGFAAEIIEKLNSGAETEPAIPGNRPYKKTGPGMVPEANDDCVGCGVCSSKCPVGAIDKADQKKTDKTLCIGCMRCVNVCPHSARAADPARILMISEMLAKAAGVRKENKLYI